MGVTIYNKTIKRRQNFLRRLVERATVADGRTGYFRQSRRYRPDIGPFGKHGRKRDGKS